ncbi:MAG: CHAT domain-containing tetratricopeptide repeat protein [Planctomycetota bacterium]
MIEIEALLRQGDYPGARVACQNSIRTFSIDISSPPPYREAASLVRIGLLAQDAGDPRTAQRIWEIMLRMYMPIYSDDSVDLSAIRQLIAHTRRELGDVVGALELDTLALEALSKTLPESDPQLLEARTAVGSGKAAMGDLEGAIVEFEKVVAVRSALLPDNHHDLLSARLNAAVARKHLHGDLLGALTVEENALEALSKTLPDNHLALQQVRQNLAITKYGVGDLNGSLALAEKVLAVYSSTMPDGHCVVSLARMNLGIIKRSLGDLRGSIMLQDSALSLLSARLSEDHPYVQSARQNLGNTKRSLGDLNSSLALHEKVLAARSATLPDDHPDLQSARLACATSKRMLGDVEGAQELGQKALTALSSSLPTDHPGLVSARANLGATKVAIGDHPAAAELCLANLVASTHLLARSQMSAREAGQVALAASSPLSDAGSLLDASVEDGNCALSEEIADAIKSESLELLTSIRSAELRTAELLRIVHAKDPVAFATLARTIARASRDLECAVTLPAATRTDASGKQISRDDAIRKAVLAKDAAERALIEKVPTDLRMAPTLEQIAASLAADEVAVAFLTYTRWINDPEKPWITTSEPRFAAFALSPSGRVTWHSLAPVATIAPLIAIIRRHAALGTRITPRSTTATTDAWPGIEPEASGREHVNLDKHLTSLRDLVLTPILAALPRSTKRIVLSPADEMQLAPIEDLPLADGRTFGEAFEVRTLPSLCDLARKPKERAAEPRALVVGGIDYNKAPAKQAPIVPEAATPILGPIARAPEPASASPDSTTSSGDQPTASHFVALQGTATEAEQLKKLFAATFPTQAPTVLREADASEAAFIERAPGKTFLHLATHGYFAPETYWRAPDAHDSPLAYFDAGRNDRTAQLSPFSLTGITFAGANLPPDELGRREGILTAQEITSLDLTACYLATLSACNTTLGIRRGGTGLASLRQAFHAAGARFVLATLWEVDDLEAQKLMIDFYTRLWKNGEEPRHALRSAKRASRERRAAFRDWAGWAITGL